VAKGCQTLPVNHRRWEGGYRLPQHGGGLDPPHEIFDFAGTPMEGEACLPLLRK